MKNKPVQVFIRALDGKSEPYAIDASECVGSTNYDRFLMGLLRKVDLDRFVVDSSSADEEHQRRRATRKDGAS